jgi:oxygen-independent coproporphyrinogen-3 oxidase
MKQLDWENVVRMAGPVGIYISVPFCKAKCTFCNFASGVFGAERMQQYVNRLCEEMRTSRAAAQNIAAVLPRTVDTIYFGGGTPSLLSAQQFRPIFQHLRRELAIAGDAEIPLSARLGSSRTRRSTSSCSRMNRISFGVQSFVDRETAAVGRLHTRQGARRSLRASVWLASMRSTSI